MKCPVKKRVLFQKDMFEKRCAVVKSPWWHVEKIIIYWENHHVTHRKILCQVFKIKWSEIVWYQKVVKKEKLFRRKYSVNTLTDFATVDFGCASSSSQ